MQVYAQAEGHLAHLAADPEAADRNERVHALVECPQPLVSLFAGRFAAAASGLRQLMLEVLARRYYRIRTLTGFQSVSMDGRCCVSAEYDYEGKHIHVFTTHVEYPWLSRAAGAMSDFIAEVPADHDILIDFYVWHDSGLGDPEATQQEVCSMLEEAGFPRSIRRIVVAIA